MSASLVFASIAAYFAVIYIIAFFTSRGANSRTFFSADKEVSWYIVAYGMIGASISGVTFISVPGWVGTNAFSYMQMVLGYLLGYAVIAMVLLPLYYRLNLISIYTYLEDRFGFWSYKTGAFFFLLSRTIGSSFRMFLVAAVLQVFIFDELGISFTYTVIITVMLIWSYTFRGGIKTIIWTDLFQTTFMLASVIATIYIICRDLDTSLTDMLLRVWDSEYSRVFFFDNLADKKFFFKQFFGGAFIAIVMTGLDQEMMQKNLVCRTLRESQKNVFSLSYSLIFVNLLFLTLGACLYLYAAEKGITLPNSGDQLFPSIAKEHLGAFAGITFILGVIAAAYSSADATLASLTTSFCIDFLEFNKTGTGEAKKRSIRMRVHFAFTIVMMLVILGFKTINDKQVIDAIFEVAGYTYGPLLGLYAFGLLTKWKVKDRFVPFICAVSPVLSYALQYSAKRFWEFQFGYELLVINGLITFIGLMLVIEKGKIFDESQLAIQKDLSTED